MPERPHTEAPRRSTEPRTLARTLLLFHPAGFRSAAGEYGLLHVYLLPGLNEVVINHISLLWHYRRVEGIFSEVLNNSYFAELLEATWLQTPALVSPDSAPRQQQGQPRRGILSAVIKHLSSKEHPRLSCQRNPWVLSAGDLCSLSS